MRLIKAYKFEIMLVMILAAVAFESTCAPTIDNSFMPNLDKVVHFLAFGCIGLLLAVVVDQQGWFGEKYLRIASMSLVGVLCFGTGNEYLQSLTITRHLDFKDMIADVFGGAAFLIVWFILKVRSESKLVVNERESV